MANAAPIVSWIMSKCERTALAPGGLGAQIYAATDAGELTWRRLRRDPSLARVAFDEVLRFEAPVQTFFRTTTCPVEVAGVKLGEGEKVLRFLAAANRDARRWEDPARFDITRRATGHLAFGVGIHGCVGMAVARMEGEILLTLLARRVQSIELAGAPERRLNNTLRGLARLPVRVCPSMSVAS
jgi:4-methoxybenzoate monooxygenase (O-demethylating)